VSGPPHVLTLDDVLDLRAYERVREDFRRRVIDAKRLRRVAVGPIMTFVFESLDTVRFQIQEMARAERILSDEGIQAELDVYNRLLPVPGELSATLFIELTSAEELRRWLPALVGVERSAAIELGGEHSGEAGDEAKDEAAVPPVWSTPETTHAQALTRDEVTPAVHYVRFAFSEDQMAAFAGGPASLAVHHPAYDHATLLPEATRLELLGDLRGEPHPLQLG